MRINVPFGRTHLELQIEPSNWLNVQRQPAPVLPDAPAAVRAALEAPLRYPALRRALTPDDQVTIVVDERLPDVAALLTPILEHLSSAKVEPEAVTLLCTPPSTGQPWLEALPEEFEAVRVEIHDPTERKRLRYLATTKQGRRIYLNRSVVDADQLIVLSQRSYDPLFGYGGAAGALFPALSDAATLAEVGEHLSMAAPATRTSALQQEAAEVAWLIGSPFFVQVIAGPGDSVAHVLAGLVETSGEGQRLLDACWRVETERTADTVIVGVGRSESVPFAALAEALTCASRVVNANGSIVLLCDSVLTLTADMEMLRRADTVELVLRRLRHEKSGHAAAFQWAHVAQESRIYLWSQLPSEVAEELFAVPLDNAAQVQRLVGDGSCLVLPDAEKTLAVVRSEPAAH